MTFVTVVDVSAVVDGWRLRIADITHITESALSVKVKKSSVL